MKKEFNLDFIDIFNEENKNCLFQGENFINGYSIYVDIFGILCSKEYHNVNDIQPMEGNQLMTKGLLNQKYRKIFNRNQLFNN